jgi:1-acyl-sn-glycerol-3-phosphate acyltransferase
MIYAFFRLLGMVLGYPLQMIFFKRKTYFEGSRSAVRRGGKLIVSNHFNLLDYVLTCFMVFPRKLNAVASEDPFANPFFRIGMRFFTAPIQANRVTKSMRFIDSAAEVIKKGELVQIFPEGRNTPDGEIHDFKMSYLVIAYRAGCPILPIVTDGRYGLFKRVRVIVGEEIDVSHFFSEGHRTPPREELERANAYVHAKVLELRREIEQRKNQERKKK